MKKITDELRALRRQMEEDFLLHNERATAQKQSLGRLERTVERIQESVSEVQKSVSQVQKSVSQLQGSVSQLQGSVSQVQGSVSQFQESFSDMRHEFGEFSETTATYHDTWHIERKRNLQVLDLIQASLVTGGIETESRFDRIEQRIDRIEGQLGVA